MTLLRVSDALGNQNGSTAAGGSATNLAGGLVGTGGQLGKQEFLQLLVAQLRNQDPINPMNNTEFIAQLAQFSTLETLQQVQSTLETSLGAQLLDHAMNLLGRQVTTTGQNGAPITGVVQGVRLQGTDVLLDLGTSTIHLSDVQEVRASSTASTQNGG